MKTISISSIFIRQRIAHSNLYIISDRKKDSEINDFKDLRIWKKGIDIAKKAISRTLLFPKDVLQEESRIIISLIKKLDITQAL